MRWALLGLGAVLSVGTQPDCLPSQMDTGPQAAPSPLLLAPQFLHRVQAKGKGSSTVGVRPRGPLEGKLQTSEADRKSTHET